MTDSPGRRLRQRLARTTLPAPGAFNALVARAIEQAGFEAVYVSGAGLANAVYGLPDVGLVTLTEAAAHTRAICCAVSLPVVVDGDTGFGEAINIARTVRELEHAGAAAVHFEDQVLPKKCGHLDGKSLIAAEAMEEKIRAAVAARRDPDFMIIARTDARGVTSLEDALERTERYVAAGADGIFPEALRNAEELAAFARRFNGIPLVANMTEFGKTPLLTLDELRAMGYRLVIYPQTALRTAFGAITAMLADLRRDGHQRAWLDRMQTRAELYQLLDYDGLNAVDRAVTGPKGRRDPPGPG